MKTEKYYVQWIRRCRLFCFCIAGCWRWNGSGWITWFVRSRNDIFQWFCRDVKSAQCWRASIRVRLLSLPGSTCFRLVAWQLTRSGQANAAAIMYWLPVCNKWWSVRCGWRILTGVRVATHCATVLPPTCWNQVWISAPSRIYSVTRTFPPRWSIHMWWTGGRWGHGRLWIIFEWWGS